MFRNKKPPLKEEPRWIEYPEMAPAEPIPPQGGDATRVVFRMPDDWELMVKVLHGGITLEEAGQSNEALLRLMELVGKGVLENSISMDEGFHIIDDYVNPPRPRVDPRLIGKDER